MGESAGSVLLALPSLYNWAPGELFLGGVCSEPITFTQVSADVGVRFELHWFGIYLGTVDLIDGVWVEVPNE
jgi:hypothetical protein